MMSFRRFTRFLRQHPIAPCLWLLVCYITMNANWPCFLCGADKRSTIRMLVQSGRLLEQYNVSYALHEGTTLGACRDHDIFPSDTDADLILDPSFIFQKQHGFREELARLGELELKEGTDYVMWPAGTNALGKTRLGALLICLRHSQCKVPSVDFNNDAGEEVVTGVDGKAAYSDGTNEAYNFFKDPMFWPPVKLPERCFIPTAPLLQPSDEFHFPVANSPEIYLERVYGQTWRVHRQHFAVRACQLGLQVVIPLLALVHIVLVKYFLWTKVKPNDNHVQVPTLNKRRMEIAEEASELGASHSTSYTVTRSSVCSCSNCVRFFR